MKYLLLISFLFTQPSFGFSPQYDSLKSQIDSLENDIIRDFEIQLPRDVISPEQYKAAAKQIENQYRGQIKMFTTIESELRKIRASLDFHLSKGHLNLEEVEKLNTSIEYADRIILRSRKEEVARIYQKLKSKLSHIPQLEEVYNKLQVAAKADDCIIKNLLFDKIGGVLSFDVFSDKKDPEENQKMMNFTLTQGDISQGFLNSEIKDRGADLAVITQYSSGFPSSQGTYSFTLTEDESGEITRASFHQSDIEKPWIEVMGFSMGSEKENRSHYCGIGPSPASIN